MPFYEKGDVRIRYEEAGSGFPLLVIPGGGLNSTIEGLKTHPFNPIDEFKNEYRVIAADLRNAKGGESTGPLEIDRPWDAYPTTIRADGPSRHPRVHGAGLLHRRPVHLEPLEAGWRPRSRGQYWRSPPASGRDARPILPEQHQGLGAELVERRSDITMRRSTRSSKTCTAATPISCSP